MRFTRGIAVVLLLTLAVTAMSYSGSRLEHMLAERSDVDQLLYLPNGKYLEVASLGHASLLADLVYLWAIQYYSAYNKPDRRRFVEHVFGDVIATLDPHYIDAYWLGALILSVESRDVEAAIRLLEKGMVNNPESWMLPYLAGWECYHAEQHERAGEYFAVAARIPGAPAAVRRMRAGVLTKKGDLRAALRFWRDVLEDPSSDSSSLAIAERQARKIQRRIDLDSLEAALETFRIDNGGWPAELEQLRLGGYIPVVPQDVSGRAYVYDPATGRVDSPSTRVLKAS